METGTIQPEFVLNMYLDKLMIIQPSELENINSYNYFNTDAPCQLYFICRRPKITVDPASFTATRDKMELTFKVHYPTEVKTFDFAFENPFHNGALTIESAYPHAAFSIKKKQETLITVKTGAFLQSFPQEATNADFLDLELLYIGQTCGIDGADVRPGKLKNHKTLQNAYAAAVQKNPESEICLLLASFQQHNLIMTDGRKKFAGDDISAASEYPPHTGYPFNSEDISSRQLINITEAALIRYFEPPYNNEYKDIFHNPAQPTYAACYDLNIYSIGIELDTYGIANCHIFSQSAEPKWLHMKTFLFHSPEERKAIFSFTHSDMEA